MGAIKLKDPYTDRSDMEHELARLESELIQIDAASVRPLRAIVNEMATDEDRAKLTALEAQAATIRPRVAELRAALGLDSK